MKRKLLLPCMLISLIGRAQTFTLVNDQLPAGSSASICWSDLDNDNDQDLIAFYFSPILAEKTVVFENDNGNFIAKDSSFIQVSQGSINTDDIDQDGDLDVLINGQQNGTYLTRMYLNNGNFSFTQNTFQPENNGGIARFIDYDTDGKKDLLLIGGNSLFNDTALLYHNDGGGNFSIASSNLPEFFPDAIEVADIDGDGADDLFIHGQNFDSVASVITILKNVGNGNFIDLNPGFLNLVAGDGKFGDYDNDGDFDVLYDGIDSANFGYTLIYRNDGNGVFTDVQANLPPSGEPGSVSWADMDNDGDFDVLISGTHLLRNDGNNSFTDVTPNWQFFFGYPVSFCDYDADGDQDFLAFNMVANFGSLLYRNELISGIEEATSVETLKVGPNPASDHIRVSIPANKEIDYKIVNYLGEVVLVGTTSGWINVSNLSGGVYILKAEEYNPVRILVD